MNLADYKETNEDIFFLMYNCFNTLLQKMQLSSQLYVTELKDRSMQTNEIAMILFILTIILLFIIFVVLYPVVRSVNKQKDKVLSLFCEIDDGRIRRLG